MAPVAGFVPDIVTNVFRSPFFRRGNKTPRKKTSSDNVSASPSSPQAGPSDAVVLQSSPRVAMLENHVLSASVESIKEPPAVPPTSFASLDSLASENSLKSRMSNTRMKLEPIIEQPTPSVTPNVSPPHEKPEPSFPTSSHQDSANVFSSPTTIEKPQAHIVNDSPSSRTVTFLTTARAGSMRTGVLFQPFGSPYVPSVDQMNPDGSADMSVSSEDEQSAVFATPPVTPSMTSEFPTMDSPPAVVLISPSSERGLAYSPSDAFAEFSSPSRLPAPLRTASASTSDTRPSVSSRSSTGYSSGTGKSSSLPITPLDAPSDDGQLRSTTVWVGESAIEPIGVPLPTTYAEARNLANAFPEIAEEILKRPLGPSCPSSRATSPSRPAATPSPAPTSDADDADDERSQIHFPTRRREHSPDHPNWALAPDEPQSGRERKRLRGRGRERQNTLESGATSTRGGGKHRNRRGRGQKPDTAVGFERLHAVASVSETEVSPGRVMLETLLRGLKERVQSSPASSTVDADSASPCGRAPYPPPVSESEASVAVEKNVSEREVISRLVEARESARAAGSPQRAPRINVPDVGLVERTLQGQPKVDSSGFATSVPGRSPTQADSQAAATHVVPERAKETRPRNPRTATVEDVTDEDDLRESPVESMHMTAILEMRETREEKPKVPKERETVEHDIQTTSVSTARGQHVPSAMRQETSKTLGAAEVPTAERVAPQPGSAQNAAAFSSHSQPSVPPWIQQEPGSSPNVRLPSPGKSTFSPLAPEFVPNGPRKVPNAVVPDVFSSSTSQPGFVTGPFPFAPFATNPDTAAIVNIASHAHSCAAELAKRASMTNLAAAAAADSNAPASASSAMNATAALPPLFPPPVGNVTVAPPPSMTRPAVSGFVATQTPNAPAATGAFQPTPTSFAQHAPHLAQTSATARGHNRRDTTAGLNSATSAFGSPSPAPVHAGLSKRASMVSLHQPIAPSPLSRTPIVGEIMQQRESRNMPSPPIHAPTPLFGAHSKRPSVANLAAAAATTPLVPGRMAGEPFAFSAHGSSASPNVDPRYAANSQEGRGGSPVTAVPPMAATHRPTMDRGACYETSQQPVPTSRVSSSAYAWTPATRPPAAANQAVMSESTRQHTAGGALAGYDAPPVVNPPASLPASRMLNTRRASFDLFADVPPSVVHDVVAQVLGDECRSREGRERTVTAAVSPAAPLAAQALDAKLAMDVLVPPVPPVDAAQNVAGPSVRFAPVETEIICSTLSPTSGAQKDFPQELESASGHPEQVQGDSECGETNNPAVPSIEVELQEPEGPSVLPPTPDGQVTLTNLVAQLCLQGTEAPPRPTSVVPDIHAGTSDQPAHWTIDEQGKLRAKKGENQPEPESLPNPQPQAPLPAAPPAPRRRLGREQPDAYKPYFQNAGPGNVAQANERFAGLRRRSMYFAREEGGVREENGEREASPGDARGGANLWRKGSGKWRKRAVDEEQEQAQEAATVPETSRRGRERERTREGWRLRRSLTPDVEEDARG